MKILCVATKLPWPPHDGGRLVLWHTLQGLAARGHALRVIAPGLPQELENDSGEWLRRICTPHPVPVRARSTWQCALRSLTGLRAWTLLRHQHAEVSARVGVLVEQWRPDVVYAEQLQAWINVTPALRRGVPVLVRMQNVESALWRQWSRTRWIHRLLSGQARRLVRAERQMQRCADGVVTLTDADAAALNQQAGHREHVSAHRIAPGFPALLEAGPALAPPSLAVVLAGSAGWWPNQQANRWFLDHVAPALQRECPDVSVHVYGGDLVASRYARFHPAPEESANAFPSGAVCAVPLFVGSGLRMRILEAWARGVPVVASPRAAAGLPFEDGTELLLAESATAFVAAIRRLRDDPDLRARLVVAGRARLARDFDPFTQSAALEQALQAAIRRRHPQGAACAH